MQTNETAAADQTLPPHPLSQPDQAPVAMRVRKRNGALEPVDVNKIVRAVACAAEGLSSVDTMRVATLTIGGLYDSPTPRELDVLSIQTSASLIAAEPEYSLLPARLLSAYVSKDVSTHNLHSFS